MYKSVSDGFQTQNPCLPFWEVQCLLNWSTVCILFWSTDARPYAPWFSSETLALHKPLTYLLTYRLLSINDWYITGSQGLSPSSAGQAAERTLAKVGRGVTLSLERSSNSAWLYNRSEFAVFVLSPTTHVVIKVRPAQSACVYQWSRLWLQNDEDRKTDFELTSQQPQCILVSFVKGWSGRYKRQNILSCPCWLQLLLAPTPDGSWNDEDANGKPAPH